MPAAAGLAITILAESYTEHISVTTLLLVAIGCFTFSLFITYGVGGAWRHHGQEWRFYQPGAGGTLFVILQVRLPRRMLRLERAAVRGRLPSPRPCPHDCT